MSEENISVRQWQEQFRAGAYSSKDRSVQCEAGWYDWFCRDEALAGRLKKISSVVMGITDPYILDNYYVWFKNNCPVVGPLYDDVRFEPLSGERDGKYFLVTLDSPHERMKWSLITERYGFGSPEFDCANVRDMIAYINNMGHELQHGIEPFHIAERRAIRLYHALHFGSMYSITVRREGEHRYSYESPKDGQIKSIVVSNSLKDVPPGYTAEQAEKLRNLYVFGQEGPIPDLSGPAKQTPPRRKGQER